MAVTPSDTWTREQRAHYVEAQQQVSDVTGHPLAANVELGYGLPSWAPADGCSSRATATASTSPDGEAPPTNSETYGIDWLLVERGLVGLCVPLNRKDLTPERWTSLVRADAAFADGQQAYVRWSVEPAGILRRFGQDLEAGPYLRADTPLLRALEQFDASLRHLMDVGLPGAPTLARTARTLGDGGSFHSFRASQMKEIMAEFVAHVSSESRQMTADYTSLLPELVAPATR